MKIRTGGRCDGDEHPNFPAVAIGESLISQHRLQRSPIPRKPRPRGFRGGSDLIDVGWLERQRQRPAVQCREPILIVDRVGMAMPVIRHDGNGGGFGVLPCEPVGDQSGGSARWPHEDALRSKQVMRLRIGRQGSDPVDLVDHIVPHVLGQDAVAQAAQHAPSDRLPEKDAPVRIDRDDPELGKEFPQKATGAAQGSARADTADQAIDPAE